ncbi:aminotransferase class I/II-fold pyridoxal phosphate-dependent enzyme [Solwaraspora sp. WMMA2101]|uniref:aminotransferase class I/II-fold pyridoxal phosphate-dependent enzyme n=1 Tax=Solwaraspora sp. WMMA2101 TaxID=3404124 RepID=UPI003B941E92
MAVRYQPSGSTAIEIAASVEAGVRTGELAAGDPLPAVRSLAAALGVSPATVARAYQTLRHRGIVDAAGRRGTRIRPRPPVAGPRSAPRPGPPPGGLDLSTGEPDRRLLPGLAGPLAEVARKLAGDGATAGYADAGVLPEVTALATERLAEVGLPPGALTLTSGALDGLERLLTSHLRPGDRVAVEDPGWADLLDLVAALGLTAVPMPVDDSGPTDAGLRQALTAGAAAVVVTTRAQNPTGAVLGPHRAAALRATLRSGPDVLLIEDDHAAELSDAAPQVLAGASRRWAFLRSASKPYGPDLRVAVLAGDEATVGRVVGRARIGAGWVSTVLQRLLAELWRDREVAATVAAAGTAYRHRRQALRAALTRLGVASHGDSGLNVWIPVPDELHAVTTLHAAGYCVSPGSRHRLRSAPGIRVTVSSLDDPAVPALAAAIAQAATVGQVRTPAHRPGVGR